jgi:hypothetical protein
MFFGDFCVVLIALDASAYKPNITHLWDCLSELEEDTVSVVLHMGGA